MKGKKEKSTSDAAHVHSFISKELLDMSFKKVKDIFEELMNTGRVNMTKTEEVASNLTKEMQKIFLISYTYL
ncbi:hypothetical protein [Marinitoga lauensis]|uniref:hypothetical protein n=1 Tax=Marinitoga lauensis TaxID=2201189 RepID=UPI001F0D3383|nr:hypothetical protein [Marinitoga lauensis]